MPPWDACGARTYSEPTVPTFYERPLTWLFGIAAICLDAVALSVDHEGDFATVLGLGQLLLASGWLVLGQSHPLARATWVIVAIAVLTAPDYVIPRLRSGFYIDLVWPHVLGELIAGAAFTSAVAAGWLTVLRGFAGDDHHCLSRKPQFSLATLFGWMIVVAVASTGLRNADFSLIDDNLTDLISGCGLALSAATAMAAALGAYRASWSTRMASLVVVASGAVMSLAAGVSRQVAAVHLGAWVFVVMWIVVTRLDRRMDAKAIARADSYDGAETALRLVADER